MSDESDCLDEAVLEKEAETAEETETEAWFKDSCVEADDTDEDEKIATENEVYERELLGEDDFGNTEDEGSYSGLSSDELTLPSSDVTFSPTSSSSFTSSLSVSSGSTGIYDDDLEDNFSERRKRKLSDSSDEDARKKLIILSSEKDEETAAASNSYSETDSDVPDVTRKRKLGNVIAIPSYSSSEDST